MINLLSVHFPDYNKSVNFIQNEAHFDFLSPGLFDDGVSLCGNSFVHIHHDKPSI